MIIFRFDEEFWWYKIIFFLCIGIMNNKNNKLNCINIRKALYYNFLNKLSYCIMGKVK